MSVISVIGIGFVGQTLGRRWAETGHTVIFGTRDPESQRVKEILQGIKGDVSSMDIGRAVQKSDIVTLAVPWAAVPEVLNFAGSLDGKIIIDCVNPLRDDLNGLVTGDGPSAGEQIGSWATGAKVVKAFNTVGTQVMDNPSFAQDRAVLFICGNDDGAKAVVRGLAGDIGFDVKDTGGLVNARSLERLAALWIKMAYDMKLGQDFAFKLLTRSS